MDIRKLRQMNLRDFAKTFFPELELSDTHFKVLESIKLGSRVVFGARRRPVMILPNRKQFRST